MQIVNKQEKSPYRPPRIRRPTLTKKKRQLDYKPDKEKKEQIERLATIFGGYKGYLVLRLTAFFEYLGYKNLIAYERAKDYTRKGIKANIKYTIIADLYEENLLLKEKIKILQNKEKMEKKPE